ncbi:hypothetical protein [uncultured Croceitalea sp.]|uniref:hypothetical protein n=1 Tax=uncultured Croceitalea sp. TaxID=1798908 RepID=UPI0033067D8B
MRITRVSNSGLNPNSNRFSFYSVFYLLKIKIYKVATIHTQIVGKKFKTILMKKYYLSILLAFTLSSIIGQNTDPQYLFHDYIFSDLYIVEIIEIHPDSTYTSKTWSFEDKKDWTSYKNIDPDVKNGRIIKEGAYFRYTEYKNGKEVTLESKIKLNKRMLVFYYPNSNGKLEAQGKYKRIN